MRVKISADSTCDIPEELLRKHDIGIVALSVIKDDKAYKDGTEITPDDIFNHVDNGGTFCKTTAVNIDEYHTAFEGYLQKYDAVVHINISSEMSSCHQNAKIAAEDMENVYVFDSHNLSTGMGMLVLDAALLAENGVSPDAICALLDRQYNIMETSFIIDTLDYLHKGGRCSSLAVMGANLMKLKPCIEVIDGKMHVTKKYRGKLEKVLLQYMTERLNNRTDIDKHRVAITYTKPIDETILNQIRTTLTEYGFETIIETVAGSTISCHCGRSTLGIIFNRKCDTSKI